MSTWYDVYCLTCKDHLGLQEDGYFGKQHSESLIHIADAMSIIGSHWSIFRKEFYGGRLHLMDERIDVDPAWFSKHHTHRLVVIDEYGTYYEECFERFRCCPRCDKEWEYCRLPKGHDGEHSSQRVG